MHMYMLRKILPSMQHTYYCNPINIGGYLIWQILGSGQSDCYLNWLGLMMFSKDLINSICMGPYLISRFLSPS